MTIHGTRKLQTTADLLAISAPERTPGPDHKLGQLKKFVARSMAKVLDQEQTPESVQELIDEFFKQSPIANLYRHCRQNPEAMRQRLHLVMHVEGVEIKFKELNDLLGPNLADEFIIGLISIVNEEFSDKAAAEPDVIQERTEAAAERKIFTPLASLYKGLVGLLDITDLVPNHRGGYHEAQVEEVIRDLIVSKLDTLNEKCRNWLTELFELRCIALSDELAKSVHDHKIGLTDEVKFEKEQESITAKIDLINSNIKKLATGSIFELKLGVSEFEFEGNEDKSKLIHAAAKAVVEAEIAGNIAEYRKRPQSDNDPHVENRRYVSFFKPAYLLHPLFKYYADFLEMAYGAQAADKGKAFPFEQMILGQFFEGLEEDEDIVRIDELGVVPKEEIAIAARKPDKFLATADLQNLKVIDPSADQKFLKISHWINNVLGLFASLKAFQMKDIDKFQARLDEVIELERALQAGEVDIDKAYQRINDELRIAIKSDREEGMLSRYGEIDAIVHGKKGDRWVHGDVRGMGGRNKYTLHKLFTELHHFAAKKLLVEMFMRRKEEGNSNMLSFSPAKTNAPEYEEDLNTRKACLLLTLIFGSTGEAILKEAPSDPGVAMQRAKALEIIKTTILPNRRVIHDLDMDLLDAKITELTLQGIDGETQRFKDWLADEQLVCPGGDEFRIRVAPDRDHASILGAHGEHSRLTEMVVDLNIKDIILGDKIGGVAKAAMMILAANDAVEDEQERQKGEEPVDLRLKDTAQKVIPVISMKESFQRRFYHMLEAIVVPSGNHSKV